MTAPAVTGSSVALAESARLVQLAIRAALLRDVARLWPALDAKRLDETFPGWLRAMTVLVTNYHGQSAAAASRFYRQARTLAIESPTPSALVKLAPVPSPEWMARAFGFSGPGMLSRDTVRPNTALSTTLGTAARVGLDGGRTTILNTVEADKVAIGWYRVTDGDPCAFCALLASRPVIGGKGALYRSEKTADFKSHNDCGCSAAPMFSRDQELPALSHEAAFVYENRGDGSALEAFRQAWADRQVSA
jgi:hypothetical protein